MRETPLYGEHRALSGKIVDFNGWALPIQFSGIVAEHEHTRTKVSLFDWAVVSAATGSRGVADSRNCRPAGLLLNFNSSVAARSQLPE